MVGHWEAWSTVRWGWAAARVWGARPKVQPTERAPPRRAVRMSTSESPIMMVFGGGDRCAGEGGGFGDEGEEAFGVGLFGGEGVAAVVLEEEWSEAEGGADVARGDDGFVGEDGHGQLGVGVADGCECVRGRRGRGRCCRVCGCGSSSMKKSKARWKRASAAGLVGSRESRSEGSPSARRTSMAAPSPM